MRRHRPQTPVLGALKLDAWQDDAGRVLTRGKVPGARPCNGGHSIGRKVPALGQGPSRPRARFALARRIRVTLSLIELLLDLRHAVLQDYRVGNFGLRL
jgi:hypothetical protein